MTTKNKKQSFLNSGSPRVVSSKPKPSNKEVNPHSQSARADKLPDLDILTASTSDFKYSPKDVQKRVLPKRPQKKVLSISEDEVLQTKKWISYLWKQKQLIPFEVLDLKLFLVSFCGFDVAKIDDLPRNGYSVMRNKHRDILLHLEKLTGSSVFHPDHLGYLFYRLRRVIVKNKRLPQALHCLLTSPIQKKMGYFISDAVRLELIKQKDPRLFECTSTTRIQSIIANITLGKLVFVPEDLKAKIELGDLYDPLSSAEFSTFKYIMTGLGGYTFSSLSRNPIASMDTSLNWLVHINSLLRVSDDLLISPFQKKDEFYPWEVNLRILRPTGYVNHTVYLLVEQKFIDKYSCGRNITLRVSGDQIWINDVEVQASIDAISEFLKHLDFVSLKPSNLRPINTGDMGIPDYQLTLIRPMAKFVSYMSELNKSRLEFLSEKDPGVYNITIIAGKGSGKSSLTNLLKDVLKERLFIEDSDDYGKFLTWMLAESSSESLYDLDALLTEDLVVTAAEKFARAIDLDAVKCESFFNILAENFISELPEFHSYIEKYNATIQNKHTLGANMLKMLNRVYALFAPVMRSELQKISNLKFLNQKFFQDGLLQYAKKKGINVYISFLHLIEDNIRRRAPNRCVRYLPITNASLSVSGRAASKGLSLIEFVADMALTMLYDESSQYVTPITGPVSLLQLFGVTPILSSTPSIELKIA